MPEGDSVAGHAERLRRVLVGERIDEAAGTSASVRSNSARLLGATCMEVRSVGKNLVIDFSTGYSVRVHLGMTGRWRVTQRDTEAHGSARLVLATAIHRAACYAAPTIEVVRTPAVSALFDNLGPDLLGDFDEKSFVARARALADGPIAGLLLDQRALAGIGNVYKSELLFLERIHPETPVSRLGDDTLQAIAERARRLLSANVGSGRRSTTGSRRRGQEMWVYGRGGRPCRRCGTTVVGSRLLDRVTYWCPRCQPPGPRSGSSG